MKDIAITEGGKSAQFGNVKRLVTSLQSSGTCAWVPEDEVRATMKYISENGTYLPSDEGVYGYSKVSVNVRNAASGGSSIIGIYDGTEYEFSVDDEGNIVTRKVVASIAVTTPPTTTLYAEDTTINYSGIVVKAYDSDGELYDGEGYTDGVIPFDELVFSMVKSPDLSDDDVSYNGELERNTAVVHGWGHNWQGNHYEFTSTIAPKIRPMKYLVYSMRSPYNSSSWPYERVNSGYAYVAYDENWQWLQGSGAQLRDRESFSITAGPGVTVIQLPDDSTVGGNNPDYSNATATYEFDDDGNLAFSAPVQWTSPSGQALSTTVTLYVQGGYSGSGGGSF